MCAFSTFILGVLSISSDVQLQLHIELVTFSLQVSSRDVALGPSGEAPRLHDDHKGFLSRGHSPPPAERRVASPES